MNRSKYLLTIALISLTTTIGKTQIMLTTEGVTQAHYVKNVLLEPAVAASNITFEGNANAAGKFSVSGLPDILGMDRAFLIYSSFEATLLPLTSLIVKIVYEPNPTF